MSRQITDHPLGVRQGANSVPPLGAVGRATEFTISGMTCNNCVRHVTQALQSVSGVASARVDLEAGRATVQWQADARPNSDALLQAVRTAGYEAEPIETEAWHTEKRTWSPLAGWQFKRCDRFDSDPSTARA